ncbi:hypothetical protein XM38_005300 [Halomicronema hongdechloris C2206]|uniref:Circadian input-output histidine kinase CikA n=1 Tax=Halomicronema hongdechloris C2206 TaxID=1641165 RepID=A0A1Z3HH65_9CYAN|nr:ATP-binding protein [Halomicronema hongdechloris]ASC69603.1 hypothetical protein XM38_005300 [Halomicronema hongdechloris C2206]
MQRPAIPANEMERLAALYRYQILDTPPEQDFDDLTQMAAQICETPIALISLIDETRQWFKSCIGLDVTETPRDISFCGHVVAAEQSLLVIPDTTQDARFADNPLVLKEPNIRFYAGVPLVTPDHYILGTLCVIDRRPRTLTDRQIQQLKRLSRLVISHLELRRNEAAARLLASAVESSDDAIITQTLDGLITSWNVAAERLFGYTQAEAFGQPLALLVPPDHLEEDWQMMGRIKQGERLDHFETVCLHKTGTRLDVSITISPLQDTTRQIVGFSTIVRDMTEQKRSEQAAHFLSQAIAINKAKSEFLASMSHELRTPLNAVLGMAEGLLDGAFGELNSEQNEALQTIERSGSHLLALINDILDFSSLESRRLELTCVPTAVALLCESSMALIRPRALKKAIRLEIQLLPDLPDLLVDRQRICQVLINLLSNAVKFTPAGGQVLLKVFPPPQAAGQGLQNSLRLAVIDTGIGIAPENLNKLFQPFAQIDSALNRQYEGTGLGLALVKHIVELHGGQVGVSSEVGVGSCFTVDLPCTPGAAAHRQRETPPETRLIANQPGPGVSPLILLAEDNDANVSTISSYLKAQGCQVLVAHNGQEAIALAQAETPDLILMDIQMPIMDGLAAMRRIRQDPDLAGIPIIALTSLTGPGDCDRCLEAGANNHLAKPIRLKQLVMLMQQCLAQSET